MSDVDLDKLNEKLKAIGITPIADQPCPSRDDYLRAKKALNLLYVGDEEVTGDEKALKAKAEALRKIYLNVFYQWFAHVNPHLLYEIGEDKAYYLYNDNKGIYEPINHTTVRGLVAKLLHEEGFMEKTSQSSIQKILTDFRGILTNRGVTLEDFDTDTDVLHCANGWLNIKTKEFEDHSPTRLSLRVMPVNYNKDATCPLYDKFIDEDIKVVDSARSVLDEYSGLILSTNKQYQKMLTIIGRPGCGKSTLLEVWSHILGEKSTKKSLDDLSSDRSRFDGYTYIGRTLVWFDEVDLKRSELSGRLGNLISGLTHTVERKGIGTIIEVPNYSKCVLTANTLPMGAQTGIFRRLLHVQFRNSFTDNKTEDKQMFSKLVAESSGILNRMLRGLDQLTEQGHFTDIEGHDEFMEEYKTSSDVVAEFLDAYFVPDDEGELNTSELHSAFIASPQGKRFNEITPQKFGHMMGAQTLTAFSRIEKCRLNNRRYWKGLKIKDDYEIDSYGRITRRNLASYVPVASTHDF